MIMGLVTWRAISIIVVQTYITPHYFLLLGSLSFLFVYQLMATSFFWGKRRGEFEYAFLEKSAKNRNALRDLKTRLKEVDYELKYSDPSAHSKLKEITTIYPDNFVGQFKYAISCERIGQVEDAISAYEKALSLVPKSSKYLNIYVKRQIARVKTKGPSKYSVAPGLRWMLY